MKKPVLHSAFLALIGLVLSPMAVSAASPPPADSVHFCAFDDYEQLRRDHPRPAAKRLADLNAGEPRTVRMIYFLPNDWPYRADVVDSMKTVIKQSQTFYREQMQAHGYGDWTFGIETDAQGEPLVHRVDGQHPFSHYDNTLGYAVIDELEQTFDLDANIYFIVLGTDALRQGNGQPAGGVGSRRTKNGGHLVVPARFSFFTVAHELGHTFGLYHDFRDNRYIMSYGYDQRGVLSACAAEFLAVHAYFNPDSPVEEGPPPTVAITSPTTYQPGTRSVPVQLRVGDSEGLHQVSLIGNAKPCRGVPGKTDAVVEFNYDGSFWEHGFTNLSDQPKHSLLIIAVDVEGNVSETVFSLGEISPYEIVTRRDAYHVSSIAFSPDGALLAYGAYSESYDYATVALWDMETRENTVTLWQTKGVPGTQGVPYVAFSREGTLASGSSDGIKLWDVATRRETATLPGPSGKLALSPDAALVAASGRDITLWDVESRERIAVFKGTKGAFSSDGTLLATSSGSRFDKAEDSWVRLWDLAKRAEISTLARYIMGTEV